MDWPTVMRGLTHFVSHWQLMDESSIRLDAELELRAYTSEEQAMKQKNWPRLLLLASAALGIGCTDSGDGSSGDESVVEANGEGSGVPQAGLMFPDYELEAPPIAVKDWHTVAEAKLVDTNEVIGVLVEGQARAYSLWRLSGIKTHLAFDSTSDRHLLVTYCDRSQCVRVFDTQQRTADSLVMRGWQQGEMRIELDGEVYAQSSDQLPLEQVDYVRTTWKEWKAQHPDTLLFE